MCLKPTSWAPNSFFEGRTKAGAAPHFTFTHGSACSQESPPSRT